MSYSSDEEDDIYTNAAARFKALQTKEGISKDEVDTTPVVPAPYSVDQSQPKASVLTRGRAATMIRSRVTAQTERCNDEIVISDQTPMVTIDLEAPSPTPPIIIDCDDTASFTEIIDCDLNSSNIIEDDYEMDVKVRWRSCAIKRIKLRMNEKFAEIFRHFALQENVPESQILLTRNDVPINHSDTPASINLKIIDILEGGVVDTKFANIDEVKSVCKIKIQSTSSTKHYLCYELGKSEQFKELYEYCSKEKNISSSNIRLYFDGECVSPSDTPDSLDLDDEACIDMKIIGA